MIRVIVLISRRRRRYLQVLISLFDIESYDLWIAKMQIYLEGLDL